MTDPQSLIQSALQLHLAGNSDQAESLYRRALQLQPNHPDALHLLGVLLAQRGKHAEGLPLLQRAVQVLPQIGEFQRHLGDVLGLLNRHQEALAAYASAMRLDANDVLATYNAARSCAALKRFNDAVQLLSRVVNLKPDDANAWTDLGIVLIQSHNYAQALQALQRALSINPDLPPALTSLSDALRHLNRVDEAYEPARRGAQLQPDDPWPHVAFGNVLQVLARFDEAIEQYRIVLRLDPDNFDAVNNLGLTVLKNGQPKEALEILEQAVNRWPDRHDLRANYSLALLTLGDLDRGFTEYEARFQSEAFRNAPLPKMPRWDGSDITGKTILLNSEQGLGDTIQFARFIPLIAARGTRVIVSCPKEIRPLISTIQGAAEVFESGSFSPTFDTWAPMASLPHIFRLTESTIPRAVPYLKSDPARVAAWRERLANPPVGQAFLPVSHQDSGLKTQHFLNVGIVWSGSPLHQNDRARSCSLDHFLPLTQLQGVRFFSLQKGPAASALTRDIAITPLGDQLTDFTETAALIEALDLVISVDTSVVHVAGALARPVWTLLPAGPDWRWMFARPDSPWYPTMKLFRQPTPGDWVSVFEQVTTELRRLQSSMTH